VAFWSGNLFRSRRFLWDAFCVPAFKGGKLVPRIVSLASLFVAVACAVSVPALGADSAAAPDLSGFWQHSVPQEEWENPPSGPGPVRKINGKANGNANVWVGDDKNPILKPWAAEAVRKEGELEKSGGNAPTGQWTCRPSGLPDVFTLLAPLEITQSQNAIAFLYQRDHQVRIIHLNQSHKVQIELSYYGDSVGHYEGDTLVVDTVGMNDKTWTDRFGTPHTTELHVVERYHIKNDGKTLEDFFTVEDPGAFTTPWSAVLNYSRARVTDLDEEVCAENNRGLPVPTESVDPISGEPLPDLKPE
jgi:hypothetical protein